MTTEIKVKKFMREELKKDNYFLEPQTGEINHTLLAEFACEHFDDYQDDNIPENYFDWAVEVAPD